MDGIPAGRTLTSAVVGGFIGVLLGAALLNATGTFYLPQIGAGLGAGAGVGLTALPASRRIVLAALLALPVPLIMSVLAQVMRTSQGPAVSITGALASFVVTFLTQMLFSLGLWGVRSVR